MRLRAAAIGLVCAVSCLGLVRASTPARAAAPVFTGVAGQRVSGFGIILGAGCSASNAVIDFGDGTTGPPDLIVGQTLSGSHVYAAAGTYLGFLAFDETCSGSTFHVSGTPGGDSLGFIVQVAPAGTVPSTVPLALSRTSVPVGSVLRLTPGSALTAGATQLNWDLNSDGRVDASCPASTPLLETTFSDPGSATVSLGITGASSAPPVTVTAPLIVTGATTRRGAQAQAATGGVRIPASQAYACIHDPLVHPAQDVTGNGGPPAGCVDRLVVSGVEAVGCLTAVDATGIPGRELALIDPILSSVPGSGTRAGQSLQAIGGGTRTSTLSDFFPHVATSPVRVNGIDIAPAAGAAVVVVPAGNGLLSNTIASSDATVSIGRFVLRRGPLVLRIGTGSTVHVGDFTLPGAVPLADLISAHGSAGVDLVRFASLLTAHVSLPPPFSGVTGDVTLRADNDHGLVIDGFSVRSGSALLAGLPLQNVSFTYRASDDTLEGQASVVLPSQSITAGLGFRNGAFDHLAPVNWDAGVGNGIPVGPGVFITHLGAGVRVNPTEIYGEATVSAGQSVGGGCALVGVTAQATLHFSPGPFALDEVGNGQVGCIDLTQMRLHIDATGRVHIGAGFAKSFGPLSVNAQADFDIAYPHFQFDGNADGCLDGLGCVGGELVFSDHGLAFCADTTPHWGAGLEWPPPADFANPALFAAAAVANLDPMLTSCDIDQYRSIHMRGSTELGAREQQANTTFTVTRGERELVVGVVGQGGVPRATLHGPGGVTIALPTAGALHTSTQLAFPSTSDATAWFAVEPPAPGTWTIDLQPGSVPIADVHLGHAVPPPAVRGTVHHERAGWRLDYRVTRRPGQVVTFAERAPGGTTVIGVARHVAGSIRFSPSDAPGRRRSIEAWVTEHGVPRAPLTVARFTAPPAGVGRPAVLRGRAGGGRFTISWGAALRAERYEVRADISDGRRLVLLRGAGRRRVVLSGAVPGTRATVRVMGVRGVATHGPAAVVRLRAPGTPPPLAGAPVAAVRASLRPSSIGAGRRARVVLSLRAPAAGPVRVSVDRLTAGAAVEVGAFPLRTLRAGAQTLGLSLPPLDAGRYVVRVSGQQLVSSVGLRVR